MRIQHVIQHLVASVLRGTPTGGTVRVATTRRSDGGLEILVGGRGGGPLSVTYPPPERSPDGTPAQDGINLSFARAIVEAHSGTLTFETSAFGGLYARLILPSRNTRDIDLAEINSD